MRRAALCVSLLLPAVAISGVANAAEQRERKITTGEIEKWLEAEPGTKQTDEGPEEADEEPLPAPRHHGFIVESGVGFVNHLGELKNITPMAPWFQVRVGFEPFAFLMPFVEADASFASTAYASRPPPPRSFWHYGAGAGLRLTFAISQTFGLMAQGSFGLALISEQNVLSIYGFPEADEPALYAGGEVGLEWYPVNPHLTLGLRGGIRTFGSGLAREQGGDPPLAALGSAQIRYAF